jgi:hypothetical protein
MDKLELKKQRKKRKSERKRLGEGNTGNSTRYLKSGV